MPLDAKALLLGAKGIATNGARTLLGLGAPGLTTRNKKLLVTKGSAWSRTAVVDIVVAQSGRCPVGRWKWEVGRQPPKCSYSVPIAEYLTSENIAFSENSARGRKWSISQLDH